MGRCKTHLPQASKPSQKVLKHALALNTAESGDRPAPSYLRSTPYVVIMMS
jgi:hypothetical protein